MTQPSVQHIVNDFTINVGTVNGSGSQTANATLVDSLFHMGIPVAAKNLFPSNIRGLPTYYIIRVSAKGYTGRREATDIMVSFNAKSLDTDIASVKAGGVVLYPDNLKPTNERDDITRYALPVNEIMKQQVDARFKDRLTNMVYVGALAQILGIDMHKVRDYLERNFAGKQAVVDSNMNVAQTAYDWCAQNLEKKDPYRVEAMDATKGKILMDGNLAAALGTIYGGCTVVAWYPITPATSIAEELMDWMPKLRKDPETGKNTFSIVQVEDEIAAIGSLVGAGWAGARAMTNTSGPGISLMAEFAGYAYFTEIPFVVWNVQRMGPSTGLPTRVSQGDLLFTYYLSHGDTKHVVLLPGDPYECFEFGWRAFDIAEQLQTPVFVNSDLDIGMNMWMIDTFDYPDEPMKRGKVLSAEDVKELGGKFYRYRDEDGKGVGPRTLPGTDAFGGAYFTRGTGHDEMALYSENPQTWQANLDRLDRKHEFARTVVPSPIVVGGGEKLGLISMGSLDNAMREARDMLADEGVKADYLRVRALPFSEEVRQFIEQHESVAVVEMNQHGQLAILLRTEYPHLATKIRSVAHCDGLPLSAEYIVQHVKPAFETEVK